VVLSIIFLSESEGKIAIGVVLLFLLVCLFLFHALTLELSSDELVVSLGLGMIRKRFSIKDIRNARIVKNRWYYGWGIRLTPHGWLLSVSGFDALELELKNNRKFRIGTDDPDRLITSIKTVLQQTNS
jgi:hypothetical protein